MWFNDDDEDMDEPASLEPSDRYWDVLGYSLSHAIEKDIKVFQVFGDQNSIYEIAEFTNSSVYYLLSNISNRVEKDYRR